MVLKERSAPLRLYGLLALEKRLSIDDENYSFIRRKRLSAQAGVGGEEIMDRVFDNNTFNHEYHIIHDLHLSVNSNFQIDTVYFTPSYSVVLEMKNIAGSVRFEDNPRQMIRTLHTGQTDSFDCPGVQLEKNSLLLKEWFFDRGFDMPVYGAVVFARSSTLFENRPPFKVLFPSELPVFLRKIHQPGREMDIGTFQLLARELVDSHRDYNPFPICKTYRIPESSVMTGVECKRCKRLGMDKKKNGWNCIACGFVDRHAHREAILDWFMLFGGKLTNQECRRFLHIENFQTITRILNGMELNVEGRLKGSKYTLDLIDYFNKKNNRL